MFKVLIIITNRDILKKKQFLTCGNHSDLSGSSFRPADVRPPSRTAAPPADGLAVRDWLFDLDLKIFFVNAWVTLDDDLDFISGQLSAGVLRAPANRGCMEPEAAAGGARVDVEGGEESADE